MPSPYYIQIMYICVKSSIEICLSPLCIAIISGCHCNSLTHTCPLYVSGQNQNVHSWFTAVPQRSNPVVTVYCTMCYNVNLVCIFCTLFIYEFFYNSQKNGDYFPKHFPPETHCARKEKISLGTFAKSRKARISFVMSVRAH
jgi:hypothetical protein